MDDEKIARDALAEDAIRRDNERQQRKAVDRPAWAVSLDLHPARRRASDAALTHGTATHNEALRRLADTEVELAHARAEIIGLKAAPLLAVRRFRRDYITGTCDALDKEAARRVVEEHARVEKTLFTLP